MLSPPVLTPPFWVYYECCQCKRWHPGNESTPDTCAMVPGPKPNEWVFVCVPACGDAKS